MEIEIVTQVTFTWSVRVTKKQKTKIVVFLYLPGKLKELVVFHSLKIQRTGNETMSPPILFCDVLCSVSAVGDPVHLDDPHVRALAYIRHARALPRQSVGRAEPTPERVHQRNLRRYE